MWCWCLNIYQLVQLLSEAKSGQSQKLDLTNGIDFCAQSCKVKSSSPQIEFTKANLTWVTIVTQFFCNFPCLGWLPITNWSHVPKLNIFVCPFFVVQKCSWILSRRQKYPRSFQQLCHNAVRISRAAADTYVGLRRKYDTDSHSKTLEAVRKRKTQNLTYFCENQTNKDDLLPDWPGFASGLWIFQSMTGGVLSWWYEMSNDSMIGVPPWK